LSRLSAAGALDSKSHFLQPDAQPIIPARGSAGMSTYRRLRRQIAFLALSIARWTLVPPLLARIGLTLWRARHDLAAADVLAIYESGGFGHHVIGPDALRRMYPGKRCVMLCGAYRGIHNWYIPQLWCEPRVHLLQFGVLVGRSLTLNIPFHVQVATGAAIGRWLKRRYRGKTVLGSILEFRDALWDAARAVPGPPMAAMRSRDASEYTIPYFHLMARQPAPPAKLPAHVTLPIRQALEAAIGPKRGHRRLCCLYLRKRGSASEVDSFIRTGSTLEDYVPAIRRLVDAGYQCLLVGDRELPEDVAQAFGGWLADARTLGQDASVVALFGASEADVFIGESGGGTFLPGVNGIPTLIVNNIPYYQIRHRATAFFKVCTDRAGMLIGLKRMFGELSRAHEIDGGIIHSNTAEQLAMAVSEFLTEHREGEAYGVAVETIVGSPNDLWYADAQARISPAWLRMVGAMEQSEETKPTLAGT